MDDSHKALRSFYRRANRLLQVQRNRLEANIYDVARRETAIAGLYGIYQRYLEEAIEVIESDGKLHLTERAEQ